MRANNFFRKVPKSPGNDGLTAEFYKTSWNLLGQQLTDSLNYSFEHGELSTSQKQAIIKLIDKKDRNRRYIKNWRPISLLNVDLKIASTFECRVNICSFCHCWISSTSSNYRNSRLKIEIKKVFNIWSTKLLLYASVHYYLKASKIYNA